MTDRERLYKLTIAIGGAFSAASSGMQLTNTIDEATKGAQDRLMERYNSALREYGRREAKSDPLGMEYARVDIEAVVFVLGWLTTQSD